MGAHFNEAGLKFLRGLKRNNDREWFNARKHLYEAELRAPMLAVIGEVNDKLADLAPEFIRDPARTMMRIYRDTRFSNNKLPYKPHLSAWWARQGMAKTSGGGFYFQVSPAGVEIAAGVFAPDRDQLLAIRRQMLEKHEVYRKLLSAARLKTAGLLPIEGTMMTRPPKGFAADHPAIELIRQRRWGVIATLPAETALAPALVQEVVRRFRLAAPLVALLNDALTPAARQPLF